MRKRYLVARFWFACFILSLISGLWACSALKQKFSKKESQVMSLSREELLKDQSAAMERTEREWMKYFGESAMLMLNDGFRFHQDSGLLGGSALLYYRSQAMTTEHQKDSIGTESLSEKSLIDAVHLKKEEIEKQKSKSIFHWWLLLLIPVFWFIGSLINSSLS
jgi:hypothetical protein